MALVTLHTRESLCNFKAGCEADQLMADILRHGTSRWRFTWLQADADRYDQALQQVVPLRKLVEREAACSERPGEPDSSSALLQPARI